MNPLRPRNDESGQMLMLFALLIPILLGMAALAIDLGSWSAERRTLQNVADAAALAGAQELPDAAAAQAAAYDWAENNGIDPSLVTAAVDDDGENPSVKVTIETTHEFAFMRALGISQADVGATATAIKTSPGGAASLVPWAVLQSTVDETDPGDTVVLKYDSNDVTAGNFGAIRIDGNGSDEYEEAATGGSTSSVCLSGIDGCSDTSPVCDAGVCQSQTGNLVGATGDAVDFRMDNTDAQCDSFDEVFVNPSDGVYEIATDCNPWLDGGYDSYRVILIPVITELCNGSCDYEVVEFALFWLDGYGDASCTGSSCEVAGRFVDAEANINALTGVFDTENALSFVRLSE